MKAIVTMVYDDGTAQRYVIPPRDIEVVELVCENSKIYKYAFRFECCQHLTPFVEKDTSRAFEMGAQRQIETSKIAVDDMFGPGAYERAMNKLNGL